MAEPHFANDDDLPRTLRRERDAREREAREREAQMAGYAAQPGAAQQAYAAPDYAADSANLFGSGGSGTVTRLEIPFRHLVWFFLKAVIAAIPALVLLTAILIAGGKALQNFVPNLRVFEIIVRTPSEPATTKAVVEPVKPVATPTKR